jgi:hypothetical protein
LKLLDRATRQQSVTSKLALNPSSTKHVNLFEARHLLFLLLRWHNRPMRIFASYYAP